MRFATLDEATAFAAARDAALRYPCCTVLGEHATAAPVVQVEDEWETPSCASDLRSRGLSALYEAEPDDAPEDWTPRVWPLDDDTTEPAHTRVLREALEADEEPE
jgi:hypothetical protein